MIPISLAVLMALPTIYLTVAGLWFAANPRWPKVQNLPRNTELAATARLARERTCTHLAVGRVA